MAVGSDSLNSEVFLALSVAVAVTTGPVAVPDQTKLPEASAVADPSYMAPSSYESEKISTIQSGHAVPETLEAVTLMIVGGVSSVLPPSSFLMPSPE